MTLEGRQTLLRIKLSKVSALNDPHFVGASMH